MQMIRMFSNIPESYTELYIGQKGITNMDGSG